MHGSKGLANDGAVVVYMICTQCNDAIIAKPRRSSSLINGCKNTNVSRDWARQTTMETVQESDEYIRTRADQMVGGRKTIVDFAIEHDCDIRGRV